MDDPTSTAQWSLAIHRVSQTSVQVWAGTLFPALKMPERARVRLLRGGRVLRSNAIRKQDWQRPFTGMERRFFAVVEFQGLQPWNDYRLKFERFIEADSRTGISPRWQRLCSGRFRTLPSRLPEKGRDAFTIGLASCFYSHRDGGRAGASYKALYERGDGRVRPDITVLSGDQVYLDIGFDSLSLIRHEIRERIADDYALHWQALGSILTRGGTWMLPDDHEYWNDYPFTDFPVPTLLSLRLPQVRKSWTRAAQDAVKNIQRSPRVESFSLGNDLSVCFADLRSYRSEQGFLPDRDFRTLLDWARRRSCPGVLVLPQPLIVKRNRLERNLRSYRAQYASLLDALSSVPHDVVLLSGDVHFGRIASVPIGNRGTRLVEIISSPLSNLTGLNGIATSTATDRPRNFPHEAAARELGWKPRKVNYYKNGGSRGRFFVRTRKRHLLGGYPKARTREHFMTASFCRRPDAGGIELTANAWLVRETGSGNLPAKSFSRPFRITLR